MFSIQWELEMLGRLLLAVLLSGIIGMERESVNKFAGFRTHVLVAVGSCLMMIISISMPFVRYPEAGFISADTERIAAQVVSGIGFLGAGAIMCSGISIKGLTTAASLWAMAGLGLACGAGLYVTSVICAFLIFIVLTYFAKLEEKFRFKNQLIRIVLVMDKESNQMCQIFSIFNAMEINVKNTKLYQDNDDLKMELVAKATRNVDTNLLMERLKRVDSIIQVEMV